MEAPKHGIAKRGRVRLSDGCPSTQSGGGRRRLRRAAGGGAPGSGAGRGDLDRPPQLGSTSARETRSVLNALARRFASIYGPEQPHRLTAVTAWRRRSTGSLNAGVFG